VGCLVSKELVFGKLRVCGLDPQILGLNGVRKKMLIRCIIVMIPTLTSIVLVLTPWLHFRDAHKNNQTTIGYSGLVIAYISFQEIVELSTVIIKPSNV
jgi:hypothetical protein